MINQDIGRIVGIVVVVDHDFRITISIQIEEIDVLKIALAGDVEIDPGIGNRALGKIFE